MRWSQAHIPTLRETPAEAEIPSHQLMLRAGLVRKLAAGTYSYLPLGFRSLKKVIGIIRQDAGVLKVEPKKSKKEKAEKPVANPAPAPVSKKKAPAKKR